MSFFEAILPHGEENAIKTDELLRLMGLSDAREIRRLISNERAAGAVILSSPAGYFLPDENEAKGRREVQAFINAVTAKGANTIRAAKSAKDYMNTLPGQIDMEV